MNRSETKRKVQVQADQSTGLSHPSKPPVPAYSRRAQGVRDVILFCRRNQDDKTVPLTLGPPVVHS